MAGFQSEMTVFAGQMTKSVPELPCQVRKKLEEDPTQIKHKSFVAVLWHLNVMEECGRMRKKNKHEPRV